MNLDIAIRVEGLGKKYVIGHQSAERVSTLRDTIVRGAGNIAQIGRAMLRGQPIVAGDDREEFWALRHLNFEIRRGDVVGIIGRNGAGKSTLLKVLSRITEPSEGRASINGRVASLLEVGTGFHPELSGRENIFLNGAILGMTRAEIRRKFDEIVAFSEVEKFLDTPVKRYSSGMYVRLAFAVAAHLEPEILIVDEVLAVGDAEFQKKCLGKMQDVAGEGRTVLFVSHSIAAINALCKSGLLLSSGRLEASGRVDNVVECYNSRANMPELEVSWEVGAAPGDEIAKLLKVAVLRQGDRSYLGSEISISIQIDVWVYKLEKGLNIGYELFTWDLTTLWWSHHTDGCEKAWPQLKLGLNHLICNIPCGWLNKTRYLIAPKISIHQRRWIVNLPPVLAFDVILSHGVSPFWTSMSDGRREGPLAPVLTWMNA